MKTTSVNTTPRMAAALALTTLLALAGAAPLATAADPATAEVYIISPADGATVPPTFTVRFGLKGMGVAPAGVDKAGTGHHHLLIDVDEMPPLDQPLPMTDHVRHFGGGQTETEVTLAPGEHTLQLLLANAAHIPHDPPVLSKKITITVAAE